MDLEIRLTKRTIEFAKKEVERLIALAENQEYPTSNILEEYSLHSSDYNSLLSD